MGLIDWLFGPPPRKVGEDVTVHIISPDGPGNSRARIGHDLTLAQYEKLRDSRSGDLYAVEVYEAGRKKISFAPRPIYDAMVARCEEIDRETSKAMKRGEKMFRDLLS